MALITQKNRLAPLILLVWCGAAFCQHWYKSTTTGGASYISILITDKSVLYAGTWGSGVFYSIDKGTTWKPMNEGLTNKYIYTLLSTDNVLFAGTEGDGVFKYTTGKRKWESVNRGLHNKVIFSLAERNGVLFAAAWIKGIYRSHDGGNTWIPSGDGLENNVVYTLNTSDSILYAGTASNGVYQSKDNGITWKTTGLSGKSILCILPIQNKVWFGTWKSGIYCYNEGTEKWEIVSLIPGEPVRSFVFKRNTQTAYCAKRSIGVYHSVDFGISCTYTGLAGYDVFSLAALDDRIIAGTWGNGLFIRKDTDTAWANICKALDGSFYSETAKAKKKERAFMQKNRRIEKLHMPMIKMHPAEMDDFSKGRIICAHTCNPGKLQVCYIVKNDGKVSVGISDYSGRLQKENVTIVKGGEKQKISFCADGLTPGIYYITLRTLVDKETIPVVHVK